MNYAIVIAEATAVAVGVLLSYLGFISYWAVPFFLLVPPALLVVALVAMLLGGSSRGENPFR